MEALSQTYLQYVLHDISQVLLVPVVLGLLFFIGYAVFCVGSLLAETLTTHRSFKVSVPHFLASLSAAPSEQMPWVIASAGLLNRQKMALLTLWDFRSLSEEAHMALAKRLLARENLRYARISGRCGGAARLTPMLGLMGTLIPLGPGIIAMGQGQLDELSSSLLVAFDTTVAGLAAAFVCLIVSRVRKNRYKDYMGALESSMTTMIDKVNGLRRTDALDCDEPTDYAGAYAQAVGGSLFRQARKARAIAQTVAGDPAVLKALEEAEDGAQASGNESGAEPTMAKADAEAADEAAVAGSVEKDGERSMVSNEESQPGQAAKASNEETAGVPAVTADAEAADEAASSMGAERTDREESGEF